MVGGRVEIVIGCCCAALVVGVSRGCSWRPRLLHTRAERRPPWRPPCLPACRLEMIIKESSTPVVGAGPAIIHIDQPTPENPYGTYFTTYRWGTWGRHKGGGVWGVCAWWPYQHNQSPPLPPLPSPPPPPPSPP